MDTYTVIVTRPVKSDGFTFTNPEQALRALAVLSEFLPDVRLALYVNGGSQLAMDVINGRWTVVIPASVTRAG